MWNESPEYVKKKKAKKRWCSFSRKRRQWKESLIYCAHFNVVFFWQEKKKSIWEIQWEKLPSLLSFSPESVTRVAQRRDSIPSSSSFPPSLPSVCPQKHSSLRHSSGADEGHCRRVAPTPPELCYSLTCDKFRPSLFTSTMETEPKNTVVKYIIATLISSLLKERSSEAEESSIFKKVESGKWMLRKQGTVQLSKSWSSRNNERKHKVFFCFLRLFLS